MKTRIPAAIVAVNLICASGALAHEMSELDTCELLIAKMHFETGLLPGLNRIDGRSEIIIDPEELQKLTPENQDRVAACVDMLTTIDAADPESWPLVPDEEV